MESKWSTFFSAPVIGHQASAHPSHSLQVGTILGQVTWEKPWHITPQAQLQCATTHQHWEPQRENYFGVRSLNVINCSYRISDSYYKRKTAATEINLGGEGEKVPWLLCNHQNRKGQINLKKWHTHSLLVCSPRMPSSRQCCTTEWISV